MIYRAYHLSSSWSALENECSHLRRTFTSLQYPPRVVDRITRDVITSLRDGSPKPNKAGADQAKRLVLPFKSQDLCQETRRQLWNLNTRLSTDIQPVFASTKLKQLISPIKPMDSIVSRFRVVYQYTCSCDMSYIGQTNRHLHERIAEHHRFTSSIQKHCLTPGHTFDETNFKVLAHCKTNPELLFREKSEIHFRKPTLNQRGEFGCWRLYKP